MVTLIRSEKELRKQAQLANKIKISSQECTKNFYLSVILPSLTYSLITWVNCSKCRAIQDAGESR